MRWGVLSFYLRVFYHERKYTKGRFQYRNLHFYFSFLYNYLRHGHLIILIQFINIQYTIFDFILISDYLVTFLRSVLNSILLYEFTNSILSLLLCFFLRMISRYIKFLEENDKTNEIERTSFHFIILLQKFEISGNHP